MYREVSKIISVHSQAFKFLELVAISGEYPFTGLELALGKGRYREKIISELKDKKLIKSFYKDKIRGYRITAAAKKQLINYNPKRFAFYIEGSVETNVKKSELSRRIRLHRMAEINVLLYQAKIEIWRDCKPIIFSPEYKARYPPVLNAPTYYSSREIKEIGLEAVKVKNSRAIGITISEDDIFILYNTGNQSMKWQYKSELRMKAVISYCLKQSKIVTHYKIESMKAIMVAESMEIAYTLMTNRNNHQNHTFILDESFEHMYFVPATMQGIILLKILHHRDILQELNEILLTDLCREKLISSNYYDAIDQENRVVLFAYDFDMPRIAKFNNSVQLRNTKGVLICFDFQKETLYKYCTDQIEIQTIDLAKVERRFFGG